MPEAYTIDIHLGPADLEAALRRDVLRGLTASPKHLPPKWHYDERGSALFDAITRLPEYYLTRCERSDPRCARRRHRGGRSAPTR